MSNFLLTLYPYAPYLTEDSVIFTQQPGTHFNIRYAILSYDLTKPRTQETALLLVFQTEKYHDKA